MVNWQLRSKHSDSLVYCPLLFMAQDGNGGTGEGEVCAAILPAIIGNI